MLRHACGFKLANDGHDTRAIQLYLGHKNIQHTVRYTELSSDRFKEFWNDRMQLCIVPDGTSSQLRYPWAKQAPKLTLPQTAMLLKASLPQPEFDLAFDSP